MMKQRNTKVHVIRIPLEMSSEIQEQAEMSDRSINYIVNKMLQKQLDQEKKNTKPQTAVKG